MSFLTLFFFRVEYGIELWNTQQSKGHVDIGEMATHYDRCQYWSWHNGHLCRWSNVCNRKQDRRFISCHRLMFNNNDNNNRLRTRRLRWRMVDSQCHRRRYCCSLHAIQLARQGCSFDMSTYDIFLWSDNVDNSVDDLRFEDSFKTSHWMRRQSKRAQRFDGDGTNGPSKKCLICFSVCLFEYVMIIKSQHQKIGKTSSQNDAEFVFGEISSSTTTLLVR